MSKGFDQIYRCSRAAHLNYKMVNGTVEVEGLDRDAIEVHAV